MPPVLAAMLLLSLLVLLTSSNTPPVQAQENDTVTLTVIPNGNGRVAVSPDRRTFAMYAPITLTAMPAPGWAFSHWQGTVDSTQITQNPLSLRMDRNRLIASTFVEGKYTLATAVSGAGNGTVTVFPEQDTYEYGDLITLSATAGLKSVFDGWQGALNSTDPIETLAITENSVVTATFSPLQVRLDLHTAGDGTGIISTDPSGPVYHYGQAITLTATPDPLSTFAGWQGALSSADPVEMMTITQDSVVTATFARGQFLLDLDTEGAGWVTKQPERASYFRGQIVTIRANAEPGSSFAGWRGGLSGPAAVQTVTVTEDIRATALFSRLRYRLITSTVGVGAISRNPDRPAYEYGERVALEAHPEPGWMFVGWSGAMAGEAPQQSLLITASHVITAEFMRMYTLEFVGIGEGEIVVAPDQEYYRPGTIISLTAEASPGWSFTGWNEDVPGSGCCLSFAVNDDLVVSATFKKLRTLTVNTLGRGSVHINPERSLYVSGDTVRLRAFPDPGWHFAGWRGDLIDGNAVADILIEKDAEVTARFAQDVYELQMQADGHGSVTTDPPGPYLHGEVVALIAVPAWHWRFLGWSHESAYDPTEVFSTDRVVIVKVTDDTEYVAHFAETPASIYLPLITR